MSKPVSRWLTVGVAAACLLAAQAAQASPWTAQRWGIHNVSLSHATKVCDAHCQRFTNHQVDLLTKSLRDRKKDPVKGAAGFAADYREYFSWLNDLHEIARIKKEIPTEIAYIKSAGIHDFYRRESVIALNSWLAYAERQLGNYDTADETYRWVYYEGVNIGRSAINPESFGDIAAEIADTAKDARAAALKAEGQAHPDAVAAYSSGVQQAAAGDLTGAVASFGRAMAINPQFGLYAYASGAAKRKAGDLNGAMADLAQAAPLLRANARIETQYELGLAQLAAGRVDEAVISLKAAADGQRWTKAYRESLRDALVRQEKAKNPAAYEHYLTASRKLVAGDPVSAGAEINEAIRFSPAFFAYYDLRASATYASTVKNLQPPGVFVPPVTDALKSLDLNPNSLDSAYLLGRYQSDMAHQKLFPGNATIDRHSFWEGAYRFYHYVYAYENDNENYRDLYLGMWNEDIAAERADLDRAMAENNRIEAENQAILARSRSNGSSRIPSARERLQAECAMVRQANDQHKLDANWSHYMPPQCLFEN
jgi:hypothetical protein